MHSEILMLPISKSPPVLNGYPPPFSHTASFYMLLPCLLLLYTIHQESTQVRMQLWHLRCYHTSSRGGQVRCVPIWRKKSVYFCVAKVLEAIGFGDIFNLNHDRQWVPSIRIEMIQVVVSCLGSWQEFYSADAQLILCSLLRMLWEALRAWHFRKSVEDNWRGCTNPIWQN